MPQSPVPGQPVNDFTPITFGNRYESKIGFGKSKCAIDTAAQDAFRPARFRPGPPAYYTRNKMDSSKPFVTHGFKGSLGVTKIVIPSREERLRAAKKQRRNTMLAAALGIATLAGVGEGIHWLAQKAAA